MNDEWEDGYDEIEADETTEPCPFCGAEIYDDAEWCPSCRNYLSSEDGRQPRSKPFWILLGVVLALIPILYSNFAGVWAWMFGR